MQRAVFVGVVSGRVRDLKLAHGPEVGQRAGRHRALKGPGVEVLDADVVSLVIFSSNAQCISLDSQVDILGNQDRLEVWIRFLNVLSQGHDLAIDGITSDGDMTVPIPAVEHDSQAAAIGEGYSFAQSAMTPETIQNPGDLTSVLAAVRGFPLEAVDFLDYLDRDEDLIVLEVEYGLWVVQEDIGIDDVVFHDKSMGARWPGTTRLGFT